MGTDKKSVELEVHTTDARWIPFADSERLRRCDDKRALSDYLGIRVPNPCHPWLISSSSISRPPCSAWVWPDTQNDDKARLPSFLTLNRNSLDINAFIPIEWGYAPVDVGILYKLA